MGSSRPPAGTAGGRATERGFHHLLKALVPERAFLMGVGAQALQIIGRDACVQPAPIGLDAFAGVFSHREIERVGRDKQ